MIKNQEKIMHYVNTGEVQAGGIDTILNSGAIGSCVVITAYDAVQQVGGMAHVMLPGSAPNKINVNSTRYASNAVEELLNQLYKIGAKKDNLKICILGGANVLKRVNDTISIDNIASTESVIKALNLKIYSKSTGGTQRRTALFNIEEGCVYYTEGDSKQKLLWNFRN